MAEALKRENRVYTYKDYLSLPADELWELIDGVPYNMAPPGINHQRVSMALSSIFYNYLKGKDCEVFTAPFGVRLPKENEEDEYIKDVIMPDITIVCDKNKLDSKGCRGGPDLIVEILSPSTGKIDIKDKRLLYQGRGVKEYWIADPVHKIIQVYRIKKTGRYTFPETYVSDEKIKVGIFKGLEINLEEIFTY